MLWISFTMADSEVPRTVFYEKLTDSIRLQPGFVWDEGAADLLFPAEDASNETNWPCRLLRLLSWRTPTG
jgi:hypothetical protein